MHNLLQRFKENGVTLNLDKCEFHKTQKELSGHEISPIGIKPAIAKMSAITEYPAPTNLTELRRFMGMAQQMFKYTDELAPIADPLRELLSAKNHWIWTPVHQDTFMKIEQIHPSPKVLHLFQN